MDMIRRPLLVLLLLAAPLGATQSAHFFNIDAADIVALLPGCEPGRLYGIKDGATATDCSVGLGSLSVTCQCDGDGLGFTSPSSPTPRLDEILNPDNDTDFNFGSNSTTWTFPNAAGQFIFEKTGGGSHHMVDIIQESGNPSAGTHLLHIEADDPDVLELHLSHEGSDTSHELLRLQRDDEGDDSAGIYQSWYMDNENDDDIEYARLTVYSDEIDEDEEEGIVEIRVQNGDGDLVPVAEFDLGGIVTDESIKAAGQLYTSGSQVRIIASCIREDGADRLFANKDCDGTQDAGEHFIDHAPGGGTGAIQFNQSVSVPGHATAGGLNWVGGTPRLTVPGQLDVDTLAANLSPLLMQIATGSADDTTFIQTGESGSGVQTRTEVDGDFYTQGKLGLSAGGAAQASASACIFNSGDRLFHDTDCDEVKDGGEEWIDQVGGGGGSPGGVNTEVQFNNAAAFDGDPDFTFDGTTLTLGEAGTSAGRYALEDASSNQTCIGQSGDRIYHDTNCDGAKAAFELFIDHGPGTGAGTGAVILKGTGENWATSSSFNFNTTTKTLFLGGTGSATINSGQAFLENGVGFGGSTIITVDVCLFDDGTRVFHDLDCDGTKDAGELFVTKLVTTDCSGVTTEGESCWDSDNDCLYIGDGSTAIQIGGTCS
jgi:hypothetical protein